VTVTEHRPTGNCGEGLRAGDDRHLATSVAYAVAEAKGVDPRSLPPLEDVVDADALDAFLHRHDDLEDPSEASIEFTFAGCTVRIHADDGVCIHAEFAAAEPTEERPEV
jgi:hypothetical protein